jgi:hypothetical protein
VLAAKLLSLKKHAASAKSELSAAAQARITYFQNLSQAVAAMSIQDAHRPVPAPDSLVIHSRLGGRLQPDNR